MRTHAFSLTGLVLTACSIGAPPGFSNGDRWLLPLVGPLEDGVLLTTATIHDRGPYLFLIDPDANLSEVDDKLVEEAELRMGSGPRRIDETNTGLTRVYAELLDLRLGGLAIDRRDAMVFPGGLYDTEDRHIRGVLGRDVIADSLVFGFDRDQGVAMLSTTRAFTPPPGATAIAYQEISAITRSGIPQTAEDRYDTTPLQKRFMPLYLARGLPLKLEDSYDRPHYQKQLPTNELDDVAPVPRRIADARIGPATLELHLDLGAAVSQLREASWPKAGLVAGDRALRLVDETASVRRVTTASQGVAVHLGTLTAEGVVFVPYVERRFHAESVDGALGLDFFRRYSVFARWDDSQLLVKPRGDAGATVTARLGRWGTALPTCPHPGCLTAELASDGVALVVARDSEASHHALEIFVGVTPGEGKTCAPLTIELAAEDDALTVALPAEYAGATFHVLDAAPFPRTCGSSSSCVRVLGGATLGVAAAAAPPPSHGEPSALLVPPARLHRLTGDGDIPPSVEAHAAAAGALTAVAVIKICLGPDGKVESTQVIKSSNVARYDDELEATIMRTWTFMPIVADGTPVAACAAVSFPSR